MCHVLSHIHCSPNQNIILKYLNKFVDSKDALLSAASVSLIRPDRPLSIPPSRAERQLRLGHHYEDCHHQEYVKYRIHLYFLIQDLQILRKKVQPPMFSVYWISCA